MFYCTPGIGICVVMYIVYVYVIEENKKALGVETDPVCVRKDKG